MNLYTPRTGLACAVASYIVWALYPLYWMLITHVPIAELLAHRMIWSLAFAMLILPFIDGFAPLKAILSQPRLLSRMLLCSALIGLNWSLYVYSISIDRVLEASLGYYLGPIFTTVAAMLFLGERLRGLQYYALALVLIGIMIVVFMHAHVPWLGLGLAVSFSLYSTLRRHIGLSAVSALVLEVFFPAIIGLYFITYHAGGDMIDQPWSVWILVVGTGPLTIIPLLLYGWAVNRAPLIPVALAFYIVPTGLFILSTVLFNEPLEVADAALFAFVWMGVLLYVAQIWRERKPAHKVITH